MTLIVPTFSCQGCGKDFTVPDATLAKFPGWQPKKCLSCKNKAGGGRKPFGGGARGGGGGRGRPASSREENLTTAEVLVRYTAGPMDGVFTDGAADPNPGPGGWGAVYVGNNQIIGERHGNEPHTTNNRMELMALVAGTRLVPVGMPAVIYTDSELCVKTINEWAAAWKARGWKRKTGPIKNLELVQELFEIMQERRELSLRWIAAHSGNRWNEYADALATAYRRQVR